LKGNSSIKGKSIIKGAEKEKDETFSTLKPILVSNMDTLADLEGFLQKTVEAAASIVSARSSRLILYKQNKFKRDTLSPKGNTGYAKGSKDSINVPLELRGLEHPIGYIEVKDKKDSQTFDKRDLISLIMLGRHAALRIENDLFYHRIYENMIEMLYALVNIIESRDPYIHCHSSRVCDYALKVAGYINIPFEQMDIIRIASLLHDIGKIGIPDKILRKKGSLSHEEKGIIRTHSIIGERIIDPLAFLFNEKKVVRHHHEYFDGSGYPDGLKGEDIPIGDRIITVADAFDAMTSDRPYRAAKSAKDSFIEIERLQKIKYDPEVVLSLKRCLEKSLILP